MAEPLAILLVHGSCCSHRFPDFHATVDKLCVWLHSRTRVKQFIFTPSTRVLQFMIGIYVHKFMSLFGSKGIMQIPDPLTTFCSLRHDFWPYHQTLQVFFPPLILDDVEFLFKFVRVPQHKVSHIRCTLHHECACPTNEVRGVVVNPWTCPMLFRSCYSTFLDASYMAAMQQQHR